MTSSADVRRAAGPALISAALAAAYLIAQPASADLAAQTYRTELFERVGLGVWNGQWFGGHHTLGYSVLFPPLAALLGIRLVGALSAVAAAALFAWLADGRWGERARAGALWFGAGTAVNLFTGRLTFALGLALALGALLAAQRGRMGAAVVLSALCPLGSPIAGLFLAMGGIADALARRRREGLALAAAALAVVGALAVAFPEGGVEPFATSAWWPTVAFGAAAVLVLPREEPTLRWAAALYAVACTAAYAVDTQMGGNAARLGALLGGPVLACALWGRRPLALALLAAPLVYWQVQAPVRDVRDAADDPSTHASYHAPLIAFLERARPTGRVEIAVTRNHWETVYVSPRFPLARGWERQLDTKYNGLFYADDYGAGRAPSPARYRAWLDALAVEYVAVPDVRLDYAAIPEARMVRRGLPYLRPAWRNEHWDVYRVVRAATAASGPAEAVRLSTEGFSLRARAPGTVDVRVRHTPYWALVRGAGCVERGPDGFTRLRLRRGGGVRVAIRFAPGRVVSRGSRCRS
jgi:hypothetical protein